MSFQRRKTSEKGTSFMDTMRRGFNRFQELNFASVSCRKKKIRIKTSPQGDEHEELVRMLTSKRQRCKQITIQLKKQRQIQIVDFMRKTVKYQELLDMNDHKKKRMSLFNAKNPNSKIGEVVKVSHQQNQQRKIQYSLFTNYIHVSSAKPETREGHTTIIYQNNAIVIGGHCSNPFNQGHVFSLTTSTWKRQFTLPSPRSYHSTVLYKQKYAVIFGGMGPFDISRKCRPCYNTVNVIDLHSLNGKSLKMGSEQQVEGRKLHACTLMGKYMIVFGGINSKRSYLKDIVYLDLKELRWYQKQYRMEGKDLNDDMEQGIANHKAVGHFKENRSIFPLYSSEYSDNQGLYFFGGHFGNRNDNVLLFLGLNKYNPTLKKVVYAGTSPSSSNILAQKITENLVFLISGEVNDRMTKLYKLKQRQFVSLYTYENTPYLGGVGTTMNRCDGGLLVLFGTTQTGYSSQIACLSLKQIVKWAQIPNLKIQRRQSMQQWRLFRTVKTTQNYEDEEQTD